MFCIQVWVDRTREADMRCRSHLKFIASWWPRYHVRMQVKQFSHPEDGGITVLRNIGTTSYCRNPLDDDNLRVLGYVAAHVRDVWK